MTFTGSCQFTSKERDAETGLDYFGARYYAGAQGRFTSPDEVFADQYEQDPQSWNMYSYVRNNPLRFADPTGRECVNLDNGSQGDDGKGTACAGAQFDTTHGVTVTGKKGNALGAFALNALFALDGTASAFFRPLVNGMGVGPSYMEPIPTNREFTGRAAAATVLVGTAFIGPGSMAPILGRKLDYLLGLATGRAHSIARTGAMASALGKSESMTARPFGSILPNI